MPETLSLAAFATTVSSKSYARFRQVAAKPKYGAFITSIRRFAQCSQGDRMSLSGDGAFKTWRAMRAPDSNNPRYGGAGITVCTRWLYG
jgi:TnpA family transposase